MHILRDLAASGPGGWRPCILHKLPDRLDVGPQGPHGACGSREHSRGWGAGLRVQLEVGMQLTGCSLDDAQVPAYLRAPLESWPQGPHSIFRSHLAENSCPCCLGRKVFSTQDCFIVDVKRLHSAGTCGDRYFFNVWAQILLVLMPLYQMTH